MENGIQEEEKLTTNVVSNCKAFLLKSFNSQENSFSIQKKNTHKKTVLSLPFTISMGVGNVCSRKRKFNRPLNFYKNQQYILSDHMGEKVSFYQPLEFSKLILSHKGGNALEHHKKTLHKPSEPWPSLK